MFRIKNVRNSTVGKQSSLLSSQNQALPNKILQEFKNVSKGPQVKLAQKPKPFQNPKPVSVNKKISTTLKGVQASRKLVLRPQVQAPILKSSNKNQKNDVGKKLEDKQTAIIESNKIDKTEIVKSQDLVQSKMLSSSIIQINCGHLCQKIEDRQKYIKLQRSKIQCQIKQKEELPLKQRFDSEVTIQKQRALEEQRQKIRQEYLQKKRKREQEQQRRTEEIIKQMKAKAELRRKSRQEQKIKQLQFQKKMERLNQFQGLGGLVALSDPLAHVQMNQEMMDAQINLVLNMKFAEYPNREALERQIDELERINRSYLLVREDAGNRLAQGLSNFRIELFNRVGQLIMKGQQSLGPNSHGLRIIQADSKNYPDIKGMQVTRGMAGHINSVLKKSFTKQIDSCAICLLEMGKGSESYEIPCGHNFHPHCLQDWLNTNANCPSCRYNIKYNHQ